MYKILLVTAILLASLFVSAQKIDINETVKMVENTKLYKRPVVYSATYGVFRAGDSLVIEKQLFKVRDDDAAMYQISLLDKKAYIYGKIINGEFHQFKYIRNSQSNIDEEKLIAARSNFNGSTPGDDVKTAGILILTGYGVATIGTINAITSIKQAQETHNEDEIRLHQNIMYASIGVGAILNIVGFTKLISAGNKLNMQVSNNSLSLTYKF